MSEFPSFLSPLSVYLTFYLSTYLSVDTWLASTYHLAIMTNAAENMDARIVSESLFSIILGLYSKMELLDPVVILFIYFLAVLGLFPLAVVSGGCSLVAERRLVVAVPSLVAENGL